MAQISCYHCGLPVPDGVDFPVTIEGTAEPMCCPGCEAVATAIIDGGLASFYKFRSDQQARPSDEIANDFSAYDLEGVQEDFVHKVTADNGDAHLRVELLVDGITCAACAWLIEHHLQQLAGVAAVRVNVTNHRCLLEWNNSQIALSKLLGAMAEIGYRARPADDDEIRNSCKTENNKALQRLGVAGIGMMQAVMLAIALYAGAFDGMEYQWQQLLRWVSLVVATPVVLFSAAPFFSAAWRSLKSRHLVMDVSVSLAIGLAYLASVWGTLSGGGEVYFDSVSMFTFFLLFGRYLEMRVRHRNELRMEGLGQLLPAVAIRVMGEIEESVPVKSLRESDLVKVSSGDVIPCDGVVIKGSSSIVEAVLTGEQLPVLKVVGDGVSAGTVNSENPLWVRVQAVGGETRLSGILRLVERAQLEKPLQVALADRMAGLFVGFILLISVTVAVYWWFTAPDEALWITLSVLVVTCPCALSLATPTALTVATHELRRRGFLVSRGHVIDALKVADRIVFDKTGTLTTGNMSIQEVVNCSAAKLKGSFDKQQILALTAALEADSRHPIARAFDAYKTDLTAEEVKNEIGAGVSGDIAGVKYAIGREAYIERLFGFSVELPREPKGGEQWLLLASEQHSIAWILLEDSLRDDAIESIAQLQAAGLQPQLLSGDRTSAVRAIAQALNISVYTAEASPEQKLEHIRQLQKAGHKVVMVGDGINDVPVLSGADVSVAMGDAADITRIHADAILMSSHLDVLVASLNFARLTGQIIKQNLGWALGYNLLALPLAAMGLVPPWAAAIGMSISSLIVVLNALRLGKTTSHTTG